MGGRGRRRRRGARFFLLQVLTNIAAALGAMGIGALGLPLDLSNFAGGTMVLIFALFGRFLLNGERIPDGEGAHMGWSVEFA